MTNSPDYITPSTAGPGSPADPALEPRVLSPEAQRALAEAEARRAAAAAEAEKKAAEIGGQSGPDPVRYGDWEKGGIATDF